MSIIRPIMALCDACFRRQEGMMFHAEPGETMREIMRANGWTRGVCYGRRGDICPECSEKRSKVVQP
jgi:hypothetical protein